MEYFKLIADRFSVRKFTQEPIAEETLARILQAGMLAPTAKNIQPQRILVLNTCAALEKLDRCTACRFGAPCALLVCYDKDACWKRERFDNKPSGETDAAIVTTQMMLAATALGIGTTWVMHFDPAAVRREFALPASFEPAALLVMGHAAPDAKPSPMHTASAPAEQLIFRNKF